jgi:type II restriction enzyme
MEKKELSGNIGEWSEIYVFLYLLTKGQMNVADDELNSIPNEFYKILAILRKEAESTNNYVRKDDYVNIEVVNDKTGEVEKFSFPIHVFAEKAQLLLTQIKSKSDKKHPEITDFLSKLKIYSIKDVGHKRDITIKIEDFHCGMVQTMGFSIKSFLGANSSLFNAGPGTNFIYEVQIPSDVDIDCDEFNRDTYSMSGRIKSRLEILRDKYSAKLVFKGVQSRCLSQNLRTIDGDLPFLMSQLLLIRYSSDYSDIKNCTNLLTSDNPLDFDVENHGAVYEYKIKRFLQDCALGMVPETPWTGIYDATGGQIVVKEDGDVVCYHIYEQNRFLDYLFNNTIFEGASTSEDKNNPGHPRVNPKKKFFYGWLYEEGGKLYFKINLQVRFK